MKVPCRITGSSHQDFDFEVSCENTDPKGDISIGWLTHCKNSKIFSFLEFPVMDSHFTQREISVNILSIG